MTRRTWLALMGPASIAGCDASGAISGFYEPDPSVDSEWLVEVTIRGECFAGGTRYFDEPTPLASFKISAKGMFHIPPDVFIDGMLLTSGMSMVEVDRPRVLQTSYLRIV